MLRNLATEAQHQRALFQWRDLVVGAHPELHALYHIPNESKERRSEIARIKFAQMGGLSGVPDNHLPVARGCYSSLYIEMKKHNGQIRRNQLDVMRMLRDLGNMVAVCYSHDEAEKLILEYLNLKG